MLSNKTLLTIGGHGGYEMGDWKNTNTDLGLLVAFVIGIVSVSTASIGLLSWIDNRMDRRIDDRVAPLERKLEQIERKFDVYNSNRTDEYKAIMNRLAEEQ